MGVKHAEAQATGHAGPDAPGPAGHDVARSEADDGQDSAAWEAGLLEAAMQPADVARPAGAAGAPEVPGFEIISRLGAGSSGEVWLADEVETGRTVALKILHGHGVAGTSEELLQREFRILSKLIHPNLVLLFRAIATTDGRQGLAMEWIDGWPLDEWLDQHPDLPLAGKLELFQGMVRGVAFLHENGVIHRDLKPANVIVDAQGVAKIVDFGLARLHQDEAASGMDGGSIGVSGTLHFMAPEQAADGRGSGAMPVDVYAMGLMLHRLLTGRWLRPRTGTPAETLAQVLQPPPLELGGKERELPRDLQAILRQALAPDPAFRYHHARELDADLVRFAAKQPVAARKHTILYLATTLLRRQARRSAVAAGLVLAGLVAGGTIYQRHRQVTERNDANLRSAYTLTSFTLRQLRDELRTATPESSSDPVAVREDLAGAAADPHPPLPVNPAGELDLRYYEALLADLRAATSEGRAHYLAALKSIQPAVDLFSELARESPDDPKRLLDAAQARLTFTEGGAADRAPRRPPPGIPRQAARLRRRRKVRPPAPSASRARLLPGSGMGDMGKASLRLRPGVSAGREVLLSSKIRRWIWTCCNELLAVALISSQASVDAPALTRESVKLIQDHHLWKAVPDNGAVIVPLPATKASIWDGPTKAKAIARSPTGLTAAYPADRADSNSGVPLPVKSGVKLAAEVEVNMLLANEICTVVALAADAPAAASAPKTMRGSWGNSCMFVFIFLIRYTSFVATSNAR